MVQHCDVYINILCAEEDTVKIGEYLRDYFNKDDNLYIEGFPLDYLEVVDDTKGLVVLDLEVTIPLLVEKESCFCSKFVTFEGYLEKANFINWIKNILPSSFDVDIEIDNDSNIPTEEKLMKEYTEESESYLYND
jgi:hypothetical protein